jgi:hypothetical protein
VERSVVVENLETLEVVESREKVGEEEERLHGGQMRDLR